MEKLMCPCCETSQALYPEGQYMAFNPQGGDYYILTWECEECGASFYGELYLDDIPGHSTNWDRAVESSAPKIQAILDWKKGLNK